MCIEKRTMKKHTLNGNKESKMSLIKPVPINKNASKYQITFIFATCPLSCKGAALAPAGRGDRVGSTTKAKSRSHCGIPVQTGTRSMEADAGPDTPRRRPKRDLDGKQNKEQIQTNDTTSGH
ncbi:unnamed protein product [Colias eurytheme]|nr:unnamed protein product [Colias eurytheme]